MTVAPAARFALGVHDSVTLPVRALSPSPIPSPSEGPGADDPEPVAATPVPVPAPAGGGSGSAPAPLPRFSGSVLTQAERPISGATVTLLDGTSARTDGHGQFTVEGVHPYSPVVVAHPDFATSVITGLDAFAPFHLGPRTGLGDDFDKLPGASVGDVLWPLADLAPGVAFYQDTRGNSSLPGDLQADGSYRVPFTIDHPGPARASLVILAADLAGTLLIGLTAPFTPLAEEPPAHVPLVLADRPVAYNVTGVPLGMSPTGAALQAVQTNGPVVALVSAPGVSGTFNVPAAGALPASLRIAVEARDADLTRTSVVYLDAGQAAPTAAFLDSPVVNVNQAAHQASWAPIPGAEAYRVQVHRLDGGTTFEAWIDVPRVEVPAADWPAPGTGELVVEAVAASVSARSVAAVPGPRQLRLEPLGGLSVGRIATTRVKLL